MVRLEWVVLFGFLINLLVFKINAKSDRINTTETVVVGIAMIKNVSSMSENLNDEKITFPQETQETEENEDSGEVILGIRSFDINQNTKCEDNVCDDVKHYPNALILDILKKEKKLEKYFKGSVHVEIANRNMFDHERKTVCESFQRTVFPKAAYNMRGIKKVIINIIESSYKQGFVMEVCSKKAKCFLGDTAFPNDYEWVCKQKYSVRRLLALTDNQTDFDNFEFPSCCVCTYRRKKNSQY